MPNRSFQFQEVILSEQEVHQEYGYLAMKDGTRLAYALWRPKREGKYPTLLNYSAYWQSGAPFDDVRRYLEAGYAYVGANVRGTGASEGVFSYYQPIEGPDGAELVEWAAAQPWSTGNLGMIGASYGGHTQIKVAALRPPHLKAIVPIATEANEYRDEGWPGGLFNAGLYASWTYLLQPERARLGAERRITGGDTECAAIRAIQAPNRAYEEALQHPLYDEWWRARALDTMISTVAVPTLIIHAWQDEYIRANGAIRLFELLRCGHKKLILENGPHSISRYQINQEQQMRWLDRWLKEEINGVETEPPVTVLWEVTEPEDKTRATPRWRTTHATWPAPDLQWSTLYLTAAGELSSEQCGASDTHGMRSYVHPLGMELFGTQEQFALVPHPLGTLSYRTAPMISDTALLGSPRLTFFFSTDQTDTDFLFTMKDIDPVGNTLFLQRSVLRASLRAVDEALSTPEEITQSFVSVEKLVPGEVYEVKLSLSAFGHVVREGHRLELSILAPSPVPSPIWGFAPSPPSINSIYHGNIYPSRLHLPVLPGLKAQQPAPPLGALRNQPYRPRSGPS